MRLSLSLSLFHTLMYSLSPFPNWCQVASFRPLVLLTCQVNRGFPRGTPHCSWCGHVLLTFRSYLVGWYANMTPLELPILGAHEHNGACNPFRTPMKDFQIWSNSNNLMEIPSKGNFFTWFNGRKGNAVVERKLDNAFCNVDWCTKSFNMSSFVLPRFRSDHHPILGKSSFNQIKFKF